MKKLVISVLLLSVFISSAFAERLGSVDTDFRLIGPDNKIVIEVFEDEEVQGVTCYLSRATTGGVKGAVGIAEDRSNASLSCRQTSAINLSDRIKAGKEEGEEVFKKRTSLIFKSMQVVRFYDKKHNTLVYMVYSDRILQGSPNNSISAVPVLPWQSQTLPATVPPIK